MVVNDNNIIEIAVNLESNQIGVNSLQSFTFFVFTRQSHPKVMESNHITIWIWCNPSNYKLMNEYDFKQVRMSDKVCLKSNLPNPGHSKRFLVM